MKLLTSTPTIHPRDSHSPLSRKNQAAISASFSTAFVLSVSTAWPQPESPDEKLAVSSGGKNRSAGNLVDELTPLNLNGFNVIPLPH